MNAKIVYTPSTLEIVNEIVNKRPRRLARVSRLTDELVNTRTTDGNYCNTFVRIKLTFDDGTTKIKSVQYNGTSWYDCRGDRFEGSKSSVFLTVLASPAIIGKTEAEVEFILDKTLEEYDNREAAACAAAARERERRVLDEEIAELQRRRDAC